MKRHINYEIHVADSISIKSTSFDRLAANVRPLCDSKFGYVYAEIGEAEVGLHLKLPNVHKLEKKSMQLNNNNDSS